MDLNKIITVSGLRGPRSRIAFFLLFLAYGLWPMASSIYSQTELGSEDDLTVLGVSATADDPDVEIKGFTVFGSTQAAYTGMAIGNGNVVVNGVLAVSTGAYFAGTSTFTAGMYITGVSSFASVGNIYVTGGNNNEVLAKNGATGPLKWTPVSALGDNLGNHTATTTLNMNSWSMVNVSSVNFLSNVYLASATAAQHGGVYVSTNLFVSGISSATQYYGDGSTLTGVSTDTLKIGDSYGGGIVFWVDAKGRNALISATADQSSGIVWAPTTGFTGAQSDGVGAGKANTVMITTTTGPGSYAARLCADHTATVNGMYYDDWYLPSLAELQLLYAQEAVVGGFTLNRYWPSTEYGPDTTRAGVVYFNNGTVDFLSKTSLTYVRCVRGGPVSAFDHLRDAETVRNGAYVTSTQTFSGGNTFAAVTASSYTATGIGMQAAQLRLDAAPDVIISSEASAALGGGVRVSTNMYIVGFASATRFFGDGSGLSNLPASPGDNLGTHNATQRLNMAGNQIVGVSSLTVIAPDTITSSLWVSTSAAMPHLYVSTNGNIGIGTANTAVGKLTIGSGQVLAPNGDAGAPPYSFTAGTGVGMYSAGAGQLNFSVGSANRINLSVSLTQLIGGDISFITGGSERARFDTSGRFGIGTTNPQTALHVVGTMTATGYINTTSTAGYAMNGYTILRSADAIYGTFVGSNAGRVNTGTNNSFLGSNAGYNNGTGSNNSAVGYYSLFVNTSGTENTAFGASAGLSNQTGVQNTFIGTGAGRGPGSYTSASGNTFIGYNSGYDISDNSTYNTFLGYKAGSKSTIGSNNIVIGPSRDTSVPAASNELNIGDVLYGNLSAKTIGISTRAPQAALDIVSTGTLVSQYAQIWRASNGTIVSSMTATGVLYPVASGSDNTKVAKTGDMMTGQLTNTSSITVTGNGGVYGLEVSSNVSLAGAVYSANGNIGIGTADPAGKLTVASGQILGPVGTAAAPAYSFIGDPDTGVYRSAANRIGFAANGAGSVQIGGGAPRLVVSNTSSFSSNSNGELLQLENNSGADDIASYFASGGSGGSVFSMRKSRGTIAAPTLITTADTLGQLIGYGYVGATNGYQAATRILFDSGGTISDSPTGIAGIMRFLTADTGGEPTERLTISNNGAVGIGTTTPMGALNVVSTGAAANQMAQAWGNTTGAIVSSISATGVMMAVKFVGDGTGITGITGDNLGNHTATQNLTMTGYNVTGARYVTASSAALSGQLVVYGTSTFRDVTAARYQIAGSTVLSMLPGTGSLGVGVNAGNVNSAAYNTFVGNEAGRINTTGSQNSFVGYQAGYYNVTGGNNTFVGLNAGYLNTASGNSFIGTSAGQANTMGINGTFVGFSAGDANGTGSENSFFGNYAGRYTASGSANAVFGNAAGGGGGSGGSFSSSTIMGYEAGNKLTTGNDNIFLGWRAGYAVTTGTGNIVIGYNRDTSAIGASNELNIGGVLYGNLSSKTIGISTRVPQAALDIVSTGTATNIYAQIWRDGSGNIVSSMTSGGVLYPSVSGSDNTKVAKTGDTMTGQLTVSGSSLTVSYGVSAGSLTVTSGQIRANNGNTNAPAYSFISSPLTGLHSDGTNEVSMSINGGGNIVQKWKGDGVFIGNTGNAFPAGNPAGQLHVLRTSAGSAGIVSDQDSANVTGSLIWGRKSRGNPSARGVITSGDDLLTISGYGYVGGTNQYVEVSRIDFTSTGTISDAANGSGGVIKFKTRASGGNLTEQMRIDSSGNVGIGMTNPTSKLSVMGTSYFGGIINTNNNWISGDGDAEGLYIGNTGIVTTNSNLDVGGGILVSGYVQAKSASGLALRTSAGIAKLVIDNASGAVGIGTTTPMAVLNVVSTGAAANQMAQVWGNTTGAIVSSMSATGVMMAVKFIGDGSGITGLTGTGDNLGSHIATTTLNMAQFPVVNISSIAMVGSGIQIATSVYAGASGVFISTAGSVYTTGLGNGTAYPNDRGIGAVDEQTSRNAGTKVASGRYSVIGGGYDNTASNDSSVVGGGNGNNASGSISTIGGGQNNTASGAMSIVGGGWGCTATNAYSVAAGGAQNLSTGYGSAIGGGGYSNAGGQWSTIGGGVNNNAGGLSSTIPGGAANKAQGDYSFAAGFTSTATATGAFTWSDSQGIGTNNTVADRTLFKNRGGFLVTGSTNTSMTGALNRGMLVTGDGLVGISTGTPGAALDVVSTGTTVATYAQIWRDSNGVAKASMTATGVLYATVAGGDNLGNHTATANLDMRMFNIISIGSITANAAITTYSSMTVAGNLAVSTVAASGNITAARYQIAGSTVLAVLPGAGSLGVGEDAGKVNTTARNSYIGYQAGYAASAGTDSAFLGYEAGYNNAAINNTAVGSQAGRTNTSGANNSFFGMRSGYLTTGGQNSFFGSLSGRTNASGANNIFIGYSAGYNNTTGANNIFEGSYSAYFNQTGSANVIFGNEAGGYDNYQSGGGTPMTSFSSSTIIGYRAGYKLETGGNDNILAGFQAGYNVTTGTGNIIIGYNKDTSAPDANNELNIGGVLYGNLSAKTIGISTRAPQAALDIVSTGTAANVYAQIWRASNGTIVSSMTATGVLYPQSTPAGDNLGNHTATQMLQMGAYTLNSSSAITAAYYQIAGSTVLAILPGATSIAVGPDAGKVSSSGSSTFLGYYAGYLTNATETTFIGANAGRSTTSGGGNTFMGAAAGFSNNTGTNGVFIGAGAGYSNTTPNYNVYVGDFAGRFGVTGGLNTVVGSQAGYYPVTGTTNVVLGREAGYGVSGNSYSSATLVGYRAGYGLTTGNDNILIGWKAGYNVTTGTGNIIVGYNQNVQGPASSSQLNIGGLLFGDLSGKTIGISTRTPQAALDVVSTGTAANIYAQIWRDGSGNIVSSITSTGVLYPQVGASVPPSISVSTINASATTPYGGVNVTTNAFITGNLSIGTTVQSAPLHIYSPVAIANAMIISTGAAASQQIMRVSTTGVLYAAGGVTYGADLAEMYPVAEGVGKGDVVMIGQDGGQDALPALVKAVKGSGRVLGVISTDPGILIGWKDTAKDHIKGYAPVALAGRVPLKISLEGGAIKPGDYLALSPVEGRAMKASGPGEVVAIALEASAPGRDTVMAFISPGEKNLSSSVRELSEENKKLRVEITEIKKTIKALGLATK